MIGRDRYPARMKLLRDDGVCICHPPDPKGCPGRDGEFVLVGDTVYKQIDGNYRACVTHLEVEIVAGKAIIHFNFEDRVE